MTKQNDYSFISNNRYRSANKCSGMSKQQHVKEEMKSWIVNESRGRAIL